MAGHEWDWFQREELIGQISDIRVQNLQVERENVQKRTFTRWINLHLEKCNPPIEVKDLFVDIQDGKILMALLEVLTGQSLLQEHKPSSNRIFRLNNIAKALKFLEDSNVKLVSIDAAEIADGNPSLVLGLIWNIILFLQIKELTGNLNRMSSSSSLSSLPSGPDSDSSHSSTPSTEKSLSVSIKDQRKAIKALLNWVQQRTRKYGVAVQDFASSWKSGLAFLALIKAIDSKLVDIKQALEKSARDNLEDAFRIAQEQLSVPRLLEPEDVMVDSPDEQSIMTYVTQFLEHFPELDAEDFSDQLDSLPMESTFVHYKDGPAEEESKIITLNKESDIQSEINSPVTHPEQYHYPEELIAEYYNSDSHRKTSDWSQSMSEHNQSPKGVITREIYSILGQEAIPSNHSDSSMESPSEEFSGIDGTSEDKETLIQPSLILNGSHLTSSDENRPVSSSDTLYKSITNNSFKKDIDLDSFSVIDAYTATGKEPTSVSKESSYTYSETMTSLGKGPVEGSSEMSTNGNVLSPGYTDNVDDACKYVPHLLPTNATGSNRAKQMTVFQPYSATAAKGKSINEGHSVDSISDTDVQSLLTEKTEEPDNIDKADSSVISVIPHNLFYYPHYNVPIADVLHAYAEDSPGASVSSNITSSFPHESDHDVIESYYQDYMQTCNKEMLGKVFNSGFVDEAQDLRHLRTPNNSSSQKPTSQTQTRNSAMEPSHTENTQIAELQEGKRVAAENNAKSSKKLSSQKAELEEDFLRIDDKVDDTKLKLKEENHKVIGPPREIEEGTVVCHRRKDCVPDKKNLGVLLYPNTRNIKEQHDHISSKKTAETCLTEKVTAESADTPSSGLFLNIYTTFLLWLLLYCMLILPELDMRKVGFFANNQ
ncbi:calmin [Xenopus laevis]|uniref:Calmin n=1 Tax=Xenopus laevis TaxID=8355 RepID=A0A8J0TNE4_XENLA|nr:calmin [Xenopus laevis]